MFFCLTAYQLLMGSFLPKFDCNRSYIFNVSLHFFDLFVIIWLHNYISSSVGFFINFHGLFNAEVILVEEQ